MGKNRLLKIKVLAGIGLVLLVGAVGYRLLDDKNIEADNLVASGGSLSSKYMDSYTITKSGFDTEVEAVVDRVNNSRSITSNGIPNHETGDFPNEGNPNSITIQSLTWQYVLSPNYIGTPTLVKEPGVAINGVKFDPGTAERAICSNGVEYSIEAIQDETNLGLDFNNAHVQPTGEYHYHGFSDKLVEALDTEGLSLVHIGFAADGHLIYYSKDSTYSPSYSIGEGERSGEDCTYTPGGGGEEIEFGKSKDGSITSDWEFNQASGNLDECNGTLIDNQYVYLITKDYPYVPRCLMGEVATDSQRPGGAPQGLPPR